MKYYLSSMIITYAAVAAAVIYVVLKRYIRRRRAERKRMQRRAAREAEMHIIGQRILREMELERILKIPVCFKEKKRTPIRKAVGLFSDEAAQKIIKNA